jgi:predicted dehydrogenase
LGICFRANAFRSREAFGVAAAYDNHHDLLSDAGVDLVVVTLKVTRHYEIVSAALKCPEAATIQKLD